MNIFFFFAELHNEFIEKRETTGLVCQSHDQDTLAKRKPARTRGKQGRKEERKEKEEEKNS